MQTPHGLCSDVACRVAPLNHRAAPVTPNGGQDGRGNLRENREDPAPTVGRSEDAIAIQMSSHRRRHAHTVHPACHPPMGTYNLYHDAARRVVIRLYAVPVDACVDVDGGLR